MSTDTQCSICLTDLKKNIKTLKCKHPFHENCINDWIANNNTCPLCRDTISLSKITVLPIDNPNINNNINLTTIIPNNVINYIQINNKYKKYLAVIFYLLTFFFFLSSTLYNTVSIFQTNKYINNIIIYYNETELNNNSSSTYSGEVLIIFDVLFLIIYIITNIGILNESNNCCFYFFHIIICLTSAIIHATFQKNTMNYLNDDVLDIYNKEYHDDCILSIVLYGSSLATNCIILMFVRIYMIEFERH